jgi:hypothetical protein
MKADTVAITVRFTPEMHARLAERAALEERTITSLVRFAARLYLGDEKAFEEWVQRNAPVNTDA